MILVDTSVWVDHLRAGVDLVDGVIGDVLREEREDLDAEVGVGGAERAYLREARLRSAS